MHICAAKLIIALLSLSHAGLHAGEFSVLSWNILAHHVYEKYVFYNGQKNSPQQINELMQKGVLMPLKQRLQQFKKAFEKNNFAYKIDIVCLQEVDLKTDREGNEIIDFLKNLGYTILFPSSKGSQGTLIAYNPGKFSALQTASWIMTKKNGKNKTHNTCVTLSCKKLNRDALLTVVNCHVPWATAEGVDYQLNNIKENVLPRIGKEHYTIVCGDFNYETAENGTLMFIYGQKNIKSYTALTDTIFDTKQWRDAAKEHSLMNSPTNYFNVFQKVDYIFYTPTVTDKKQDLQIACTSYCLYPKEPQNLIKFMQPKDAGDGPIFKDFPSDHTALVATFAFKQKS